jgi:hypothetical protein
MKSGYESPTPYEIGRIGAAAVYCSDGRIGDQVDEFLHRGLGLPRYDRLAVPGGPVCLGGRIGAYWESRGVEDQLRFLVQAHELEHVVLISHERCAYYLARLSIPPERVEAEQGDDLRRAAEAIRKIEGRLTVRAFMARVGARVRFDPYRL